MSDSSENKAELIGTLGNDIELRSTGNGSVVNMTVATTESWRDKATGEKKERTEWHDVVVFDRLAESIAQYYVKGMLIRVVGILRRSRWQNEAGENRSKVEIHVTGFGSKLAILNDRGRGRPRDGEQPQQAQQPQQPQQAQQQANRGYDAKPQQQGADKDINLKPPQPGVLGMDDDPPF